MSEHLPSPERTMPVRIVQRRKEHLMQEIVRARRVRHRRRVALAAAAAATVLIGTGFGTYALTHDEPTHVDSLGCYSEAALQADVSVIDNTAQDPVAACARLWRDGVVTGTPATPTLVACVLGTGAVAVMPGSGAEVCNALGIGTLSATGRRELRRLGEVRAELLARLEGCKGAQEGVRIARAVLDAHGFDAWSVATHGEFSDRSTCASPTLERTRERVLLIASPR